MNHIKQHIVGLIALFVALGGTGYAASHYRITNITQIKPSVVAELRGHQGTAGAPGAPGPAGGQGAQGAQGAQGVAGAPGTPGSNASTVQLCEALRSGATFLNEVGIEEEANANPAIHEEGEDDRNNSFILSELARLGC